MGKIKTILLIEDHQETRRALSKIIAGILPYIPQKEAATLQQARHIISQQVIDLAFIDISLPDGNGIDFIKEIRSKWPHVYIVMSTIHDDDGHIFHALRAGANGYLLKGQAKAKLLTQLQGILEGTPPLSPAVAERILNHFHQPETVDVEPINLTVRETEVLTLLAKGCTRKEVSALLGLSVNTVSDYIKSIYRKLDVHSCAEATLEAVRMGLVSAN